MLQQLHLWTALAFFLPLVAIGLSGSVLVAQDMLNTLFDPMPHVAGGAGEGHSVADIIAAAQVSAGGEATPFLYFAPATPEQPATVFVRVSRAEQGPSVVPLLVDPFSLDILGQRPAVGSLRRLMLDLHGNLLMFRPTGRSVVGWLGVVMLALGVSGLVLWWPRRNRWRAAFVVKRGARGLRLQRDLHGAVAIWAYLVFITVSFSGVYLAFPETVSIAVHKLLPQQAQPVPIPHSSLPARATGGQFVEVDQAVAAAIGAVSGTRLGSIGLPRQAGQPFRLSLAYADAEPGAPHIDVLVDGRSGAVLAVTDPRRNGLGQIFLAWLSPLHAGEGLGWAWRILVFASGFLPAVLSFTGIAMWLIKKRARRRARAARPVFQ